MAGKHSVQCPMPPGGSATCDTDQLAICRIVNGQPETDCISVPAHLRHQPLEAFQNWVLEQITLLPRAQAPLGPRELRVLASGEFADPARGLEVRFRLPDIFADGGAALLVEELG